MTPSVNSTVLNGKLGVRAPSTVECHAYVGPCSTGTANHPTRHSRTDDLLATYTSGSGAELGISGIARWKADVLMVRSNASTPGSYGSIDISGVLGTSIPSIDATTAPDDDYEAGILIVDPGSVGTPGITYQWTLDGFRTLSPLTALGSAGSITIPNSGGMRFLLSPPVSADAALYSSVNALRTAAIAHFIIVSGSPAVHASADTADNTALTAVPAATTVATAIAAFNACLQYLKVHVASAVYHTTADTVAEAALALIPVAVSGDDVADHLPALISAYNAHRILVGAGPVHGSADSTNTCAASTASSGTLLAGDKWTILAKAPVSTASDLSLALAALKASTQPWKAAWIASPADSAACNVIKTFLDDLEATTGRARKVYVSVRMPNPGETEADYMAVTSADLASFADFRIAACRFAARVQSARTGRPFNFRRPTIFAIAGLPGALDLGVDMAQRVDATPEGLPGVSIYDTDGNPVEHDEMLHPSDNDRFITLRTWPDKGLVPYVNNPNTLEIDGGDFHLDQYVRILCVFCDTARSTLADVLSRKLQVNLKTSGINVAGAPQEWECQKIDSKVRQAILDKIKTQVTDIAFAVHRDDVILSSQTINADGGIIFDGYPKQINFTVSAINPAAT